MAIPSLNIGGGKWATKKDKLLAYKQNIGGRYFAIDGDTSRNSTATFTNQNGLIESVGNNVARVDFQDDVKGSLLLEPQSTNLITQSESFGKSYWTKSGASIQGDPSTAGVALNTAAFTNSGNPTYDYNTFTGAIATGFTASGVSAGGSYASFQPIADIVVNKTYIITYDLVINSGTAPYLKEAVNSLVQFGQLSSGVGNVIYAYKSIVGDLWLSHNAGETADFILSNVSVKEVQGFSAPSVDNPTSAFKLVEDTSSGQHYIRTPNISVLTEDNFASVIVKPDGRDWVYLFDAWKSAGCYFNVSIGVVGSSHGGILDTLIEPLVNGYYRIGIKIDSSSTSYQLRIMTADADNSNSYTGNSTSGIYIYGAQLEALPYSTSYIPTNGSAVTRVKDGATNFGDVNTFNSEEGVLFFEMSALSDGGSTRVVSLSDGSVSNNIYLSFSPNASFISCEILSNGGQANLSYSGIIQSNMNKIAIKYKENDFALWINGVEVDFDTNGNSPIGLNKINFNFGQGSFPFYGKVKQLQVYKEALTDAQLQELTSHLSYNSLAVSLNFNI